MENFRFVVFRSERISGTWTEWEAIGAFPNDISAQSYVTDRKQNDWCERRYKIENFG